MEPPHGLRNSSLLKAKVLSTGTPCGGQRGSGAPASVTASPSRPCRSIQQQEPVFKWGCPSSFLLGFLLLFQTPFSVKPKIPLLPPRATHALAAALRSDGCSGRPGSHASFPLATSPPTPLLLSLSPSLTALCNFFCLDFDRERERGPGPGRPTPASVWGPSSCRSLVRGASGPPAAAPEPRADGRGEGDGLRDRRLLGAD